MHISLGVGRKTRGYTRYSPAFISFTILPDRPLQSTLEPRRGAGKPMLLYISANNRAVSVVVVVEPMEVGKEHPLQRPVYYVSEVLTSSKERYPHWQTLVLGVFMESRKLKH